MPEIKDSARPEAVVTIRNRKGLHARASAKFVKCAESYDAIITVTRDGHAVGGTSIMGLMMLAAGPGSIAAHDGAGSAGPRGAAGAHRARRGRLRGRLHRRCMKASHRRCAMNDASKMHERAAARKQKGARPRSLLVCVVRPTSTSRATTASARCRGKPAPAPPRPCVVVLVRLRGAFRSACRPRGRIAHLAEADRDKRRFCLPLFMASQELRPAAAEVPLAGVLPAPGETVRCRRCVVLGVVLAVRHEDRDLASDPPCRSAAARFGARPKRPSSSARACTRPRRCRAGPRCRPWRPSARSC